MTAEDGEIHQECDDHAALRAEVAALREALAETERALEAGRAGEGRRDAEIAALQAHNAKLLHHIERRGDGMDPLTVSLRERAEKAEGILMRLNEKNGVWNHEVWADADACIEAVRARRAKEKSHD